MAEVEGLVRVDADLVWDYDVPDAEHQDEAFRRWYIARVLTRGRSENIRALGLRTIHAYLGNLVLPAKIRHFWEWYFGLPEVRERYGTPDATSA